MNTLTALVDYLTNNSITLPHPMAAVIYTGQSFSRQSIESNQKLLKGRHIVSISRKDCQDGFC